jgi:hypothetical protein
VIGSLEHHQRAGRNRRAEAVRKSRGRWGLDFADLEAISAEEWVLRLHFLPDESGDDQPVPRQLDLRHIQITEGAHDLPARLQPSSLAQGEEPEIIFVELSANVPWQDLDPGTVFRVSLVDLAGVDAHFSSGRFGFAPLGQIPQPADTKRTEDQSLAYAHSYLAKDFHSFRTMMLERLRLKEPRWLEQNPADVGVTFLEAVAYVADQISYFQDAVATEAYVGTARHRLSLRRHTRLLGQLPHEGCGARAWLSFRVEGQRVDLAPNLVASTTGNRPIRFMTLEPKQCWGAHNEMSIYSWGMHPHVLPEGSTSAALRGHFPELSLGEVLIFADGAARHAVRLCESPILTHDGRDGEAITRIKWFAADALPVSMSVSLADGSPDTTMFGNVVPADQGRFVEVHGDALGWKDTQLRIGTGGRPVLHHQPWEAEIMRFRPALECLTQAPLGAPAAIEIMEARPNGRLCHWTSQPDLLQSRFFDRHFVAEIDDDGDLLIRFGDGALGRRSPPPASIRVFLRQGTGPAGNVGVDTLKALAHKVRGVVAVTNPVAAVGGRSPWQAKQIRHGALSRRDRQKRCITPQDYADLARCHPLVHNAAARISWTGSWHIASVWVQPQKGDVVDPQLLAEVDAYLRPHRMMGVQLEVMPVAPVHIDICLRVHCQANEAAGAMVRRLRRELSDLPDIGGRPGYFYPGHWGIGEPVYQGPLLARLAEVPGVRWVDMLRFSRADQAVEESDIGLIPVEIHEVVRLGGPRPHGGIDIAVEVT